MEKNNSESPKIGGERTSEVVQNIQANVDQPKISPSPTLADPSEVPFVPDLEVITDSVKAETTISDSPKNPANLIDGTGALKGQFEGLGTTASGPASKTVIEFTRLKEDSK